MAPAECCSPPICCANRRRHPRDPDRKARRFGQGSHTPPSSTTHPQRQRFGHERLCRRPRTFLALARTWAGRRKGTREYLCAAPVYGEYLADILDDLQRTRADGRLHTVNEDCVGSPRPAGVDDSATERAWSDMSRCWRWVTKAPWSARDRRPAGRRGRQAARSRRNGPDPRHRAQHGRHLAGAGRDGHRGQIVRSRVADCSSCIARANRSGSTRPTCRSEPTFPISSGGSAIWSG